MVNCNLVASFPLLIVNSICHSLIFCKDLLKKLLLLGRISCYIEQVCRMCRLCDIFLLHRYCSIFFNLNVGLEITKKNGRYMSNEIMAKL